MMILDKFRRLTGKIKSDAIFLEDDVEISYDFVDSDWNVFLKELKNLKIYNEKYLFDTNLYLPKDWSLWQFDSAYKACNADFEDKKITIKPIESMENVFSLFHEISHVKSYYESSQELYGDESRIHEKIYFNSNGASRLSAIREYMGEEYVAWDFASLIVEKFEFDSDTKVRFYERAHKSLLTHIGKFDEFRGVREVLLGDLGKWNGK